MQRLIRGLIDLAIIIVVVAGGYWAISHRNELLDSYYLSGYQPPARVAALAGQAGFSDKGRKLFYRGRPQIEVDRATLVQDCRIESDKTVELGCYLTNDRIYILDINEPDLASQMAVTSAHETLHAAYNRLDAAEKRRVDAMLEAALPKIHSQSLQDRLDTYSQTEPGQRDNELHSILGTEYANLPQDLEAYYRQYFVDRAQVVALSIHFTQTFDGLHAQIDQLGARIAATKAQMNGLLVVGQIGRYNQLVGVVNNDITSYNQKVELYNRYASELLGAQPAASAAAETQ